MNSIQELTLREQENVQFTKNGTNQLIKKIVIALDTATTYFPVTLLGNMIYGLDANDLTATVNVQLNRVSSEVDQFPIYSGLGYVAPFDRFYLSWSAQAGKTITLLVGSLGKDIVDVIDNRSAAQQTTLLQNILTQETAIKNNSRSLNGDTGSQVSKSATANNATSIIHTVTAGKTLYLTHACLSGTETGANFPTYLFVTDNADVLQYRIAVLASSVYTAAGGVAGYAASISLHTPLKIPATWKVKVLASATGYANAFINGWEE